MGPAPITAKLMDKADAHAKKELIPKNAGNSGKHLTPNSEKHIAPVTRSMENKERKDRKNQNFIQHVEIVTFFLPSHKC